MLGMREGCTEPGKNNGVIARKDAMGLILCVFVSVGMCYFPFLMLPGVCAAWGASGHTLDIHQITLKVSRQS